MFINVTKVDIKHYQQTNFILLFLCILMKTQYIAHVLIHKHHHIWYMDEKLSEILIFCLF